MRIRVGVRIRMGIRVRVGVRVRVHKNLPGLYPCSRPRCP
jgi:hypothetical protein